MAAYSEASTEASAWNVSPAFDQHAANIAKAIPDDQQWGRGKPGGPPGADSACVKCKCCECRCIGEVRREPTDPPMPAPPIGAMVSPQPEPRDPETVPPVNQPSVVDDEPETPDAELPDTDPIPAAAEQASVFDSASGNSSKIAPLDAWRSGTTAVSEGLGGGPDGEVDDEDASTVLDRRNRRSNSLTQHLRQER